SGMGFCSGNEDGDLTNRHSMDAAISYDIIPLDLNLWPHPITSNGEWNMSKKRWSNYLEEEYKYLPGDYDHDRLTSFSEFKYYQSKYNYSISNLSIYQDGINVMIKHNIYDWIYRDEDPDNDGIPFEKEFKFFNFGANPFVKDIFIEIDYMNEEYDFFEKCQNLISIPFINHNIAIHFDTGFMGRGGELINYIDTIYITNNSHDNNTRFKNLYYLTKEVGSTNSYDYFHY
ncbi:MAG: hypothetical protein QCI82_12255, partial [Candidatus Thermoplasmatota archaeon]|nr:hypothetical protein [Candidatus Thermoplasmatota archaeon]